MMDIQWDGIRGAYSPQSIDDLWAQDPVINKIVQRVQQEPIVTIVGTPHSGRDSVLRLIEQRVPPCVNYSFLQYTGATNAKDFWQRLADDLVSRFPERTVQPTSSYRFPRDVLQFFQDFAESGVFYLLLDDFDRLQRQTWEQPVLDTFQSLSNVPNLHIALVGDIYPCGVDMSEDFPFDNLTTPIHLGTLVSRTTLERYVRRAEPYGVEYARGAIEAIIELAGREPVLIQRLCAEIAALLENQESRRVGEDEVGAAKLKLINEVGSDIFLEQWFSLTFMEQLVLIVVRALEQEFGEGVSPEEVRLRLHDYSCLMEASETGIDIDPRSSLKLLRRRSILNSENWRYTFANALFSDWLPQVPDPDHFLSRALCKGFAALARSASYSSKLEGWLVETGFLSEKHSKEKLIEDLFLLVRGKPKARRPIILHISDTQFGKDHAFASTDPHSTQSLFFELRRGLNRGFENYELPRPNIIVISGDIANWAKLSEYECAKQFIEELCKYLEIDEQHVVLVPGNHDVNFKISQGSYLKIGGKEPYEPEEDWPNEEHYPLRFVPFQRFFEAIYRDNRRKYSPDPEYMYTIYDFRHLGLLIVGFNSCDKIDHRAHLDESRRQGFICEQAIENARQEISKAPCELVVAVWHHNPFPVASATDFLTNGHKVAEILGSKCRLALHGHIHQLANTQILPSTFSAPGIRCVGAGTIGVKEEHRGGTAREGHFPMSFNVIELNLDSLLYKGRIHTLYAIVSGLGDIRTLDWQRFTWDGKQWYDFELA